MNHERPQTNRAVTHRSSPLVALLAFAPALAATSVALASSHREAPFITSQPKVDGTDLYAFRSYEPGRESTVTLLANYYPLQDPFGGPNYFMLDPNAQYEIHIDNNGDGREDLTFRFRAQNKLNNVALGVGGKQVAIPIVQAGPVASGDNSKLNVNETYTVELVRGDRRRGEVAALTSTADGSKRFTKPVDYIGQKTLGDATAYENYARQYVYTATVPGCNATARMFVGQRKDPFKIAVGPIFDLINVNPLGAPDSGADDLAGKNITTFALELPIACVTSGSEPVIGVWTTASLRQGRVLVPNPKSGNDTAELTGGAWVQVSRLGMPLTNEVIIGLKDKNKWNGSKPRDDAQFADYVTNPTLPALIQTLFPSAPAPTHFPRQDLVNVFLTGLKGVNQPANVQPSEMLRLNTAVAPTAKGAQNTLGVLAGDAAGFPNGRRPGDDVVDAALRVAMGVLCTLNNKEVFGCVPADAPAGSAALTDTVAISDADFDASFPYVRAPLPGAVTK